jgi:hypothetical protein
MTKRQAILLDTLLKDFTNSEYQGNVGVNIDKVVNGNVLFKNLSKSEINNLLYVIRKEQIKNGIELITGESIFVVYKTRINDFLNDGGFKSLRKKRITESLIKWIGFVMTVLTFILLIYSTFFQENIQNEKPELKSETSEKVDLSKVPDSLELIADKNLKGDFNGDNKTDFASIVENKNNQKTGVIIIHNSSNKESFVFGAGKEVDNMTDLNWIEIFKTIPKGEIVAPELVDEETGDLLGTDESQNFKLIGNGIYMSVTETHGGGIIFWNGKEYQWYHIE